MLLLAGCLETTETPETTTYECVTLYRCAGSLDVNACITYEQASSEDEAGDLATDNLISENPCPWVYIRPFCN